MSVPPQPWDPNIPADIYTSQLATDGPVINANWNAIGNLYSVDHVPLGSTALGTSGYHNQTTFVTQSADPVADPDNLRIFSKLPSGSTIPQLYLQFPTSSGLLLPLLLSSTASFSTAYSTGSWVVQEVDIVVDGLQIKLGWANTTVGNPLTGVITFGGQASPNPFPTQCVFAGTILQSSSQAFITNVSVVGFTLSVSLANPVPYNIGYIAWGN